jgi:hypothetical protein
MEREISMEELEAEIDIILHTLRLKFRRIQLVRGAGAQFVCEDFGVIVSAINRTDYSSIKKVVREKFPGYRDEYVSTFDDLLKAREDIIWALMQSGYIKLIRMNFPRQFNKLIVSENFGNKIIDERLRRWGDVPKYRFFVEENKKAKEMPATMVLSMEPGFFDYMP